MMCKLDQSLATVRMEAVFRSAQVRAYDDRA